MKYFVLNLLILLFPVSLSAQNPATPQPFSTPYAESSESWQIFAPIAESFSLEVPGAISPGFVQSNAPTLPSDGGLVPPIPNPPLTTVDPSKSRSYLTLVNGDYYFMFSDPVAKPSLNRVTYNFAESQAPGIDPNEIYTFIDSFGYYHKILIIKSDDRVYTFQTVSATKDSASAERFFDQLKIKGTRIELKENVAVQNVTAKAPASSVVCKPFTPPSSTESVGNGIANTSESADPPGQTNAIRIISKPRPNYTDYARFYQVTGSVMLRVTFLANKQIGAISVVKSLPFGLTEEAKGAACGMRFEPTMKNGVFYSVTKQVQYNFILY